MKRLSDWQRPKDLALAIGVSRLTIYRWITCGRVQVDRIAPRVIKVRLVRHDRGHTREPKVLRGTHGNGSGSGSTQARTRRAGSGRRDPHATSVLKPQSRSR